MSKPAKEAAAIVEDGDTAASSQFPNMQVFRCPGIKGVALVPEPESGYLTERQVLAFRKREIPPELNEASVLAQELFVRAPLVEWRFENLAIDDEVLTSMEYPAGLKEWVYTATQPHLERIFSKKN